MIVFDFLLQRLRGTPVLAAWIAWVVACAVVTLTVFSADGRAEAHAWAPASDAVDVEVQGVTLPSGDAADVYFPRGLKQFRRLYEHRLPLVALLQGANADKVRYAALARSVAGYGFVVVVPNHWRVVPPFPGPVLFAEVDTLDDVLAGMAAAAGNPNSPLYGIVDIRRMGLIGHSLGGSVGLYAIGGVCVAQICSAADPANYKRPAALRAAAVYGPDLADASGNLTDLDTAGVAVALFQGSADGIAPPAEAAQTIPTLKRPRALIRIEGANHYAIRDVNSPAGARPDPKAPALPQPFANVLVGRWMGIWLRATLLHDPWARYWLYAAEGGRGGPVSVTVE